MKALFEKVTSLAVIIDLELTSLRGHLCSCQTRRSVSQTKITRCYKCKVQFQRNILNAKLKAMKFGVRELEVELVLVDMPTPPRDGVFPMYVMGFAHSLTVDNDAVARRVLALIGIADAKNGLEESREMGVISRVSHGEGSSLLCDRKTLKVEG